MKILMLVNWKIEYTDSIPKGKQPPDYYVSGEKYWFFRYFQNQDIDVDVVDISSFPWIEKFEKEKIRFYVLQTLKVLGRLRKYDVVISHGMQSGIVLCLFRRIFGKGKYKHIVFDIGAFNSAREEGKALRLMQFASKSLDGVIYHTESQIEYYKKCHPWLVPKSKYIVFGTDVEFFAETNTDVEARTLEKSCKIVDGNDRTVGDYILCAGFHQRDWNTLIKAYALSSQKKKLRLIGNPDIKIEECIKADNCSSQKDSYSSETENSSVSVEDDIKNQLKTIDLESLKQNIEIMNSVSVEEFKNQIRNAYFCVLPLENLNFSFGQMTLLQQMAMGKAVLVADVPSVKAYLGDQYNLSYKSGDVNDLKQKLDELMEKPDKVNFIGMNAKNIVGDKFDEVKMASKIERAINSFVN